MRRRSNPPKVPRKSARQENRLYFSRAYERALEGEPKTGHGAGQGGEPDPQARPATEKSKAHHQAGN
jgi:hypothetical protein